MYNENDVDNNNNNGLILATRNGKVDIIKMLLKKGININHQNNLGYTALMYASYNFYDCIDNNYEIMKILLENDADMYIKNNRNLTTFNDRYCCIESLKILILNGYDYTREIVEYRIDDIKKIIESDDYKKYINIKSSNIFSLIVLISDKYYNVKN